MYNASKMTKQQQYLLTTKKIHLSSKCISHIVISLKIVQLESKHPGECVIKILGMCIYLKHLFFWWLINNELKMHGMCNTLNINGISKINIH